MAPLSSSSCSLPQSQRYNLRPRRAKRIIKENSKAPQPQACGKTCPRSHDTPEDMSEEPVGTHSGDQTSKKRALPLEVDSPAIKKSAASVDVNRIRGNIIIGCSNMGAEVDATVQILEQDGITAESEFYVPALVVLSSEEINRKFFLLLKTPEGRLNFIQVKWAVRKKN